MVTRPTRWSKRGQKAHVDVRETQPEVWEASEVCPRVPRWVERPIWRAVRGRNSARKPPEGLGGPPRCPGSPHGGLGGVGRPT